MTKDETIAVCPTCKETYSNKEWNENTRLVVNSLNGDNNPIIKIENRFEGCLYRCPNENCEDEVITLENGSLATQSGE